MTAIVLWSRRENEQIPPRSGGHIVIEILRDLATKCGLGFYAQACSPGCTNMFAHPVLRLSRLGGETSLGKVEGSGVPCVDTHIHCDGDSLAVASVLGRLLSHEGSDFAILKNYARRIRDLEALARSMVDELLGLNHSRIARSQQRLDNRLRSQWEHRSDSRRTQELISSLCLAIARIEALRGEWFQMRRHFVTDLDRRSLENLFKIDRGSDELAIESQDLAFIRSTVEQTTSRFDSRLIAWATGFVALAGLLGGVLGSLLTYFLK